MPFHIKPFLMLPLASWFLITLLVLSSGPAYAGWVELFRNDDTGETRYADKDTIRHEGDVVFSGSSDQTWRPIEPDSVGFKLWKVVCGKP